MTRVELALSYCLSGVACFDMLARRERGVQLQFTVLHLHRDDLEVFSAQS